jgi:hypothetical protein
MRTLQFALAAFMLSLSPGSNAQTNEPPATNSASSTLQAKADEINSSIAAFSRTDNFQLLIDAAKIADSLYPEPWPTQMTSSRTNVATQARGSKSP